jgi:hypothetical protein
MNPTTAGDFCRRFKQSDLDSLMQAINEARINVWKQQDDSFFDQALIDVDGVSRTKGVGDTILNWTDYTPAFFRLCAVLNL